VHSKILQNNFTNYLGVSEIFFFTNYGNSGLKQCKSNFLLFERLFESPWKAEHL